MKFVKFITIALLLSLISPQLNARSEKFDSATVARLAGRMLMVGFKADSVAPGCDAERYIQQNHVGSIILFDVDLTGSATIGSRNITTRERLRKLTSDLQAMADYPLLIATDQEGGRVQRLKPQYGFSRIPTAKKMGQMGSAELENVLDLMALELAQSGINVNLAPEADIHRDNCPAIGRLDRAYSANPDSVAFIAGRFISACHHHGVACTLKHFPGHGSTTTDSHYGLTDASKYWSEEDLRPFARLIADGKADIVMTAHILNSQVDPDYPATISYRTITELLRNQLGFDGVVLTDDLYMKGIIDRYSIEEAIILTINAGADMIMIANNNPSGFEPDRPSLFVEIIVKAVRDGRIPLSRLLESNRRIEALATKFVKTPSAN